MTREEARRKAHELVAKMTIEERASQLKYDAPSIKRLGVPTYNWWNEALHGVARAGVATVFPQAIGLAATFDEEMLKEIGGVIATEGRAKYNASVKEGDRDIYKGLTFWSPNVNIFRDPRWGRGHETYGEDPYLTSRLGVAYVKGVQGDGPVRKAAACAKHLAAHSGPEADRHHFDAVVSKKDLYETYLPAFEALVKEADVEAVMGAYNRTNGEPCCGSKTLLKDILRDEWGFEGHVVSDCWAVRDFHLNHKVTLGPKESVKMALDAGCDINCGCTYAYVMAALEAGLITEEQITTSCERLFTTRYLLGIMEGSEYDSIPYEEVEKKEHIDLAIKAAQNSAVLLKNDGILPLDRGKVKTIGVVGPNANSRTPLSGNYYGTSSRYITVLEGIQDEAGEDIRVFYSEGCPLKGNKVESLAWDNDRISEAVTVAKHSDVTVVVLGLDETLEGEEGDEGNGYASGDKSDLQLPECQRRLLEAVIKTEKPVIVVMMAGSAMDLNYADEHANAILQVWYPGARGGKAVADLLFGNVSPSGKLPVTFYRGTEDLPPFTDYAMKGRTYRYLEKAPLYPFGYGLTYGEVEVTGATVLHPEEESMQVCATVENKGTWTTEDVVQVYIKNHGSNYAVRNTSLCGFRRVRLEPGETKEITIELSKLAKTIVDEEGKRYVDGRAFTVYVGTSQPDERSVELTKKQPISIHVTIEEKKTEKEWV